MKKLLIASMLINCVFLYFITKRVYYAHRKAEKIADPYVIFKNRVKIFSVLPIDSNDIVFTGDSHIQLFEFGEMFHDLRMKNRGIAGDVTKDILNQLDGITSGKPQKIFIEAGENDIFLKVPTDTIIHNYDEILSRIALRSPKSQVSVISIFPASTKFGIENKITPVVNKQLKALCLQHKCQYIDLYQYLNDNSALNKKYDSGDGIHLNGQGYLLLKSLLVKYL
jgi:hypothetical protein